MVRFLHLYWQEVRSLLRQLNAMVQMSICNMSSRTIRKLVELISISAQNHALNLRQTSGNTSIQKSRQQVFNERRMYMYRYGYTYPALWTLSWPAIAGCPANINRTLLDERHVFRVIFANISSALGNKAFGEILRIFLWLVGTRRANAAEPAILQSVSYDLTVSLWEDKRLELTPLCQAYWKKVEY